MYDPNCNAAGTPPPAVPPIPVQPAWAATPPPPARHSDVNGLPTVSPTRPPDAFVDAQAQPSTPSPIFYEPYAPRAASPLAHDHSAPLFATPGPPDADQGQGFPTPAPSSPGSGAMAAQGAGWRSPTLPNFMPPPAIEPISFGPCRPKRTLLSDNDLALKRPRVGTDGVFNAPPTPSGRRALPPPPARWGQHQIEGPPVDRTMPPPLHSRDPPAGVFPPLASADVHPARPPLDPIPAPALARPGPPQAPPNPLRVLPSPVDHATGPVPDPAPALAMAGPASPEA
ncbi:hypothetical protein BV25DRAFT_1916912, partial [Artomyces pyxidatus]